jgi:regulator of sigma E protease
MALILWFVHNWPALLVVLFAFGLIIFVHELGHFSIAKRVGIRVHEFALGFGPKLFSRTKGETEYCLRAFPFGGFVRMEGEDDPDSDPNDPGSFQNKSMLAQVAVLGGGCFMNYMSALLVLLLIGFCKGIPSAGPTTVVKDVMPGSPALAAGIQAKDKIVAINGAPVPNWSSLTAAIEPNAGKSIKVTVQRDGQEKTFDIVPRADKDDAKIGRIGVQPSGNLMNPEFVKPDNPMQVFTASGRYLATVTLLPIDIISGLLVTKKYDFKQVKEGTGGPVMIGQMFFEVYQKGIWTLLFFWAIICCSVGAFNLIPFPALDGARIFFIGVGALRGRPLDPRKEGMLHVAGLMLLLTLMVLFTIQDVSRMVQGIHLFS